jgi:photosystem II stability/assembly factor-like uncharacterized protein
MVVAMVTIFAGSQDGLHVFAPGERAVVELASHEVSALARDGASWWAIAGGQEVWRSERSDWAQQATASEELRLNCLAPSPAGLLVGTSEARLLRLDGGALVPVDSFDRIEQRKKWYTPWGGPPDSRSIAVDGPGTVYVNVHVGGIVRSRDGGSSWDPTIDVDADVHQVTATEGPPRLVLAASARGLASSEDGGETWTFHVDGLHGSYCRAVAVAGETLLVSASEGHRGRQAAVYRRPIAGPHEPFERCVEGLPGWFGSNIDSHCLAAAGSVVAFGTEEGAVYLSVDAGKHWDVAGTGLPPIRCVALV